MDEPAAFDDEGAVANLHHEADELFGNDDGELADFADFLQRAGDVLDDGRLDALGRLVEHEHLGIADQGPGDGELLLLSAGKIAALAFAHLVQNGKQRVDLVPNTLGRREARAGENVFRDRQRRKDHAALRHERDTLAHALVRTQAGNFAFREFDRAGLGRQDAEERLEQSGFAHAIPAHDRENLLATNGETEVVNNRASAVTDVEMVDDQHGIQ
jgi:hypothetical protein